MDIEIAAILTIAGKLELLEKLLDRRMMRVALDTTAPALPLVETVYKLGEYKRLAANLAVMEHRIRCALGDESADMLARAAKRAGGVRAAGRQAQAALKAAKKVLLGLGVLPFELSKYEALPLFGAECAKLRRRQEEKKEGRCAKNACSLPRAAQKTATRENVLHAIGCVRGEAYACCPDGRTARA